MPVKTVVLSNKENLLLNKKESIIKVKEEKRAESEESEEEEETKSLKRFQFSLSPGGFLFEKNVINPDLASALDNVKPGNPSSSLY